MPETGTDSRKKTIVKWSSVDPEFNEQVKPDKIQENILSSYKRFRFKVKRHLLEDI